MQGPTTRFDSLLARGNTSDVYAVGADAVVKVPRPGVPVHWTDVEAELASAAHDLGLPTPMVLDVIDVAGRRSIVFERVEGPSMAEELVASPQRCDEMARSMAAVQTDFHRAIAPDSMPTVADRVSEKIAGADELGVDERASASELLGGLDGGTSICHGDVHPGNILVGAQGLMVIDWFDAAAGPPIADIVRSSLLLRLAGRPPAVPSYLVDVPAATLERFHATYLQQMLPVLLDDPGVTLTWEVVRSVARLSEKLDAGAADLVAIWRSRCDVTGAPDTPLANLVCGGSG
ncbi:MAG: aminoglycoside phosphotransferase family protein [Ilumatobacter sp.]|nr:aminoglycoside phosphotransferase family protein [Ilumatobacter sp.]